jgi:Concanavalin A-like lectin/glucanases superfamily
MGYSSTSGWSGTARPGGLAQLNFDAVDDYVQTPQPSGMAVNRPVTLCLWVYSTAAAGAGGAGARPLLRMSNANTYTGVMWHWGDNTSGTDMQRPSFSVDSDSGLYVVIRVTADRPLNTWEHLCATYDGSQTPGGMFIYANGVSLATFVETNTGFGAFTDNPWRIGTNQNSPLNELFQGAMDDIMVYTRALSPSELSWLYQLSRTDPAALFAPMPGVLAGPVARGAGQFFPFFR